jgi:Tfp pilus assembly protein PilF
MPEYFSTEPAYSATEVAHLTLVRSLFSAGHVTDALGQIDELLQHSPSLAIAHFIQGILFQQTTRTSDAQAALERAVLLDGTLLNAWIALASLRFDLGLLAEAQTAC